MKMPTKKPPAQRASGPEGKIKKLVRPQKDKKIAGVCIGLANYFDIDPTVIRVFWIFLLIPGGIPGILPYILCWLIMHEE